MASNTNPLVSLRDFGQSPWLDSIDRTLLLSGALAKLVAEDGITGVTTNPTIFEKAIASGNGYGEQMKALAASGVSVKDAYLALVTEDVRLAADVLKPVYDRTNGTDGYVSLEVDPDMAFDTAATVARAKELFAAVGRPNVMIKIPGTVEGLPAVTETIAAGIPVNVTLIFSVSRYEEVAEAYIAGVEKLVASGGDPKKVASVASFFVSRVDSVVDKMLDEVVKRLPGSPRSAMAQALLGRVAVHNARVAFDLSLGIFGTDRWKVLAAKGARPQRPLWASTGTKNPAYSDILYVAHLAGPGTVNTMPPATIDAFRDHGTVADRLTGLGVESKAALFDLSLLGIGLEEVCAKLEADGVKSFCDSFAALIGAVEKGLTAAK